MARRDQEVEGAQAGQGVAAARELGKLARKGEPDEVSGGPGGRTRIIVLVEADLDGDAVIGALSEVDDAPGDRRKMLGGGRWNTAKRPAWSWRVATILGGGISRMAVSHVLAAAARPGGPAHPGIPMGDTMKCA
jgi:hypothetical protein